MTSFTRVISGPTNNFLSATDDRLAAPWNRTQQMVYTAVVWPQTPNGGLFSRGSLLQGRWWGQYERYSGVTNKKLVIGVVKDPMGVGMGGALVRLYHTVDDVVLDEIYSDAGGNYKLVSDYTDAHYIVAYRTGSPDYAGTSANTIVPV